MITEVSAGGIIIHEGLILAIQNRFGEWVFPKGHLEEGETAEQAALREVWEETGIHAKIIRHIGETRYQFFADGSMRDKTVHWFLMTTDDPTIRLSKAEGFQSGRFATIEEVHKHLAYDNDRQMLEIVSGQIRSGLE